MATTTKSIALAEQKISNKIHMIRGQKVMLDRDLAELYGVETRILNQAVKRNEQRFPADFMFRLTEKGGKELDITFCDIKLGRGQEVSLSIHRKKTFKWSSLH